MMEMLPAKEKKLYYYQENDINLLVDSLCQHANAKARLLYQLPTGGGKTVVFSEIVKRFIKDCNKKVIVLTHRIELCNQTAKVLKNVGVLARIIHSGVKRIPQKDTSQCYVAMVQTLKNRLDEGLINLDDIGLVVIDEAHHNSFPKLIGRFKNAALIGVTATPFSSDVNLPMHKHYDQLVLGEQISSLIEKGYLARPKIHEYNIELNTLQTGISGDFTVSTSDQFYGSPAMLALLMHAYETHSKYKKTLIFNNGIFTSKKVLETFASAGYPIKHLDNKTPSAERAEILNWFKKTKGAILTSVSILTTGFDEPSIQSIMLYRATTSITLYHQMVGRGARRLNGKKTFTIVDLGNNTDRFGRWNADIDWQHVFEHPEIYHECITSSTSDIHHISSEIRSKFPNSLEINFDILAAFQQAVEKGEKSKIVIRDSIRQHALMCIENSEHITEAHKLCDLLNKEIDYRIKTYAKCLGTVTKNYTQWLGSDYRFRLKKLIEKLMVKRSLLKVAV